MNLLRGELYWAELPDLGRKIFLIVSWNAINRLRQPIVARVTAQERERTQEAWTHIMSEHPEMSRHESAIMETIASPDHIAPDIRSGRERFFG